MIKSWSDAAWEDFEYWWKQDKKTIKRILQLLRDIERNGYYSYEQQGMRRVRVRKYIPAKLIVVGFVGIFQTEIVFL